MSDKGEIMEKEAGGSTTRLPMAQLPDGIGLNLEEVAKLLADKNKTIVKVDDPVLMMATVINAFLAEENRLMEKHKGAITQVLATRTDKFVQSVSEASASVSTAFSGQAAAAVKEAVAEQHKAFAAMQESLMSHQTNIRWWSIVALISAVVNVGVFVFRAVAK